MLFIFHSKTARALGCAGFDTLPSFPSCYKSQKRREVRNHQHLQGTQLGYREIITWLWEKREGISSRRGETWSRREEKNSREEFRNGHTTLIQQFWTTRHWKQGTSVLYVILKGKIKKIIADSIWINSINPPSESRSTPKLAARSLHSPPFAAGPL